MHNLRPTDRAVLGAFMGFTASLALSSFVIEGITTQRTIGCAIGAILGAFIYVRSTRLAWSLLAASLASWCLVALSPIAQLISNGLTRTDPLPPSVDAVVVLSGSVTHDDMLGPEALDRLLSGLALIRTGHSSTLVITQPHPLRNHSVTTAADQRRLIALLPTLPRVLVIDGVINTRTEALGTARQLPPATAHTIAVVTSPLHTRRACSVFEQVGYHVICVPAESRDIALHPLSTASDRIAALRMALSERIAIAVYHRRGWV